MGALNQPIRLSFSSEKTFRRCPRLFELDRLVSPRDNEESPHTTYGSSFGIGIQSYLVHQNKELAIFQAWLEYELDIELPEKKKTWPDCVAQLEASFPAVDNLLLDWEVATFLGKPAIELGFKININKDFYYVGYVDAVVKHRISGAYAVVEIKTDGMNWTDLRPKYQNSAQALGYSIILDSVVGEELASYSVIYIVGQILPSEYRTHVYPFRKTLRSRLNWFIGRLITVESMQMMFDAGVFPMDGEGCIAYNRPCHHIGFCEMTSGESYAEREADTKVYDFEFDLKELIESHYRRI